MILRLSEHLRYLLEAFLPVVLFPAIAATMFDQEDKNTEKSCPGVSSRPDAALILYGAFCTNWHGRQCRTV